ncbi:APC family permease [Actinoplanes aureus]|uniref:APC family permease n=1 Tax=Actinoplanes aureus TaxID=2792083 RepID=A0A931G1H0_9ACTN|nr:APC family permease [Actinoplanes aureus]MBG0565141.1 APC family permease [Actinoplanes aureus]
MESVGTPEDDPSNALAPGRIGAAFVAVLGLAAAAPIVTAVTVLPSALAGGAGSLLPLAFAAVAVVLLLFCTGYAAMTRRAPSAGAAYAYVARGLGRPAGLTAAWLAVAGYQAIQFGLYVITGVAAAPLLRSWSGVAVPWWAVAAACWAFVVLCGTMRVEIAAGVLALLAGAEAAVLAVLTAVNVVKPYAGRVTTESITIGDPAAVDRPMLGLLLAVGVLAFAGFETTGTYAEEALRPRRSTGLAGFGAVVLIVLLLGGLSWSMIVAAGPGSIAGRAGGHGTELVFALAAERTDPWAVTLARAVFFVGVLAGLLALHHAIARYLYAMGREQVLPGVLGRTGRRTGAPRTASLTQSLVAGAALAGAWAAGADPGPGTARWLIVGGALSILVLYVLTSLAALLHLNRNPGVEGAWTRFLAPVLSTVSLTSIAYLAFRDLPGLLDLPAGYALVRAVPGALAGCLLLGLCHAAVLRARNPVVYAGIGLGGAAVVITPQPPAEPEPPRIPRQRTPGAHRPERVELSRRSPGPE